MSRRTLTAEEAALAALPSLGPTSARWLIDAGITSPAQLRKLGAVDAFRRVAFHRGGDVTWNLLYALDCAIRDKDWREVSPVTRLRLRRKAERATA